MTFIPFMFFLFQLNIISFFETVLATKSALCVGKRRARTGVFFPYSILLSAMKTTHILSYQQDLIAQL
jgi:hypothetical protein